MAGRGAGVAARPRDTAALGTRGRAGAGVAGAGARVLAARHPGATGSATRDALNVAGKVLPLLVAPVAGLHSERCTGRAGLLAVAVVTHRMRTIVAPPARPAALRRPDSAGHGRVQHRHAAGAGKLVEADHGAAGALAPVTGLLAAVLGAREELAAEERAGVVRQDAALLATLVPATQPLGLALLPAPGVVRPAGQFGAGQLLVHVAAPAAY